VRWLAAGFLVNSLVHAPFALIQSAGRPDLTAKLHVLELPVYLAALWLLTVRFGVEGAAIAWTVRLLLDAAALWLFAHRLLPKGSRLVLTVAAMIAAGLLVLYVATFPGTLVSREVFLCASLVLFAIVGWAWLLDPQERVILLGQRGPSAGIESHLMDETAKQG
jgi:O-antigen/teichoic acid export membrane protein